MTPKCRVATRHLGDRIAVMFRSHDMWNMNSIRAGLVVIVLLMNTSTVLVADDENMFSFGGFDLRQAPIQLKKSFPLSRIEQSTAGNNRSVWIHVDSREVKDQVTSAHFERQGKTYYRLNLIFERPASPGKPDDFYDDLSGRLPACSSILSSLESTYGKPSGPHQTTNDTDVIDYNYVWEKPTEKLILVCGRRFNSQSGLTWVSGVTIGPSKDNSCRNTPYWCPGP
jgi:hypothetical protein